MSQLVIDRAKCQRDGACYEECPRFLIEMDDEGYPYRPEERADLCNDCGHCLAVCPSGAISLGVSTPAECLQADAIPLPSAEVVGHFLRTRRSTRTYQRRPLPRPVLERLFDIARHSPSGGNAQGVEWLVVYDTAEVRRLAKMAEDWLRQGPWLHYRRILALGEARGADHTCRQAPHIAIAHTPKGQETDGVIALTYLELAAYAQGLGACWSGLFNGAANSWAPLRETLGISEDRVCCGTMLLGYPEHRYPRVPPRREARLTWR